uniref:Chordin n=1 Tax=Trichuris muris TaxID=70415 RepID=A0A5S6Q694_TRIMR
MATVITATATTPSTSCSSSYTTSADSTTPTTAGIIRQMSSPSRRYRNTSVAAGRRPLPPLLMLMLLSATAAPLPYTLLMVTVARAADAPPAQALPLKESFDHRRRVLAVPAGQNNLGCHFGGRFYELEDEWNPDLGSPFGVMVCIRCKCVTVQKKRRIVGRVTCKNFVKLCPKPKCSDPLLLPGRCCKTCPGMDSEPIEIFGGKKGVGDYRLNNGYQEFAALMTGAVRQAQADTEGIGRAYLTLDRSTLHISTYTERLEELPMALQILDVNRMIVFESVLKLTDGEQKACAIWSDVPRIYVQALKMGELTIVLTSKKQPEGIVGGTIVKHKVLSKEVYSALLFVDSSRELRTTMHGGFAAVDVQGNGDVLNIVAWITADRSAKTELPKHALVTVAKGDCRFPSSKLIRARLTGTVNNTYTFEVSTALTLPEQRWLSRGYLSVSFSIENLTPNQFSGRIVPKRSCDVYQAVLSESFELEVQQPNGTAGYAIIDILKDSAVKYKVKVAGFNDEELYGFTIERETRRHRRRVVAESDKPKELLNGLTFGTLNHFLNVKNLQLLFRERLMFEMTDVNGASLLRGPIRRVLHSDVVKLTNNLPALLSGSGFADPVRTSAAGVAWLATVDNGNSCSISYVVMLTGLPALKPEDLTLSFCDKANGRCVAELTTVRSASVELTEMTLYGRLPFVRVAVADALKANRLYFNVSTPAHQSGEIAGTVSMPNHCKSRHLQRDSFVSEDQAANLLTRSTDCVYEDTTYKDGDSWPASHRECTSCSCQRGNVKCEAVICPQTDCANLVRLPGECCPACQLKDDNTVGQKGCFWPSDGKWHAHGTTWHPYLPPFGHSRCALCTCPHYATEVICRKTTCSTPPCPPQLRYRENALDCCPKCRATVSLPSTSTPLTTQMVVDELQSDSSTGSCFFNKHWYPNESVFAPKILHVGSLKCVTCKCQMGRVLCQRPTCSSVPCKDRSRLNGCCPKCRGV